MPKPSNLRADAKGLTEFAMALYQLIEAVRGEHEQAAAAVGLTVAQATILTLLSEPVSMRGLARQMGCDASNITGIVDRLEAKGLAERVVAPADRRVKHITQTRAGRIAVEKFQRQIVQTSSLADLTPATRQDLLAALGKLRP
jgi:DNA-binding MarR family transcriptional regulator